MSRTSRSGLEKYGLANRIGSQCSRCRPSSYPSIEEQRAEAFAHHRMIIGDQYV